MVHSFLEPPVTATARVKALIVPHAGYVYSGAVAGKAYRLVARQSDEIRRVVLVGPAHRVPFSGLAVSAADGFGTPLGTVTVDQEAVVSLLALDDVEALDQAHVDEHALEVHLPFLQLALSNFQLVPLLIGRTNHTHVAEALQTVWGGDETLIVVSSDLSHYHRYADAVEIDRRTAQAIERLQLQNVGPEQACGFLGIRGLLHVAHQRELQVRLVDLRNSGDTEGSRQEVVGYGAFVVEQPPSE
jgi:AmmeMemoRadiSam system protein B